MDCSPQRSSVHGISQARILQWVAILFSRGSSQPRDQTWVFCIGRWILYHQVTWEAPLSEYQAQFYQAPQRWPFTAAQQYLKKKIYYYYFFCHTAGSLWDLSSPTRDQTQDLSSPLRVTLKPPALEVWSLNHWTTREVPHSSTFSPSLQGPALQPLISSQLSAVPG